MHRKRTIDNTSIYVNSKIDFHHIIFFQHYNQLFLSGLKDPFYHQR